MTLLSVINAVADTVGLDRFSSVYGNADPSALTMVELAQQGGGEIARRVDWQKLLRSTTISTSGVSLPSDFQRVVAGGVRTAAGAAIRPVLNSGQWAVVRQVPSAQPYYFVNQSVIAFSPASAGTSAPVDYVSRNWVVDSAAQPKSMFTADDDTVVFPERLLIKDVTWRWKRQAGLPYDDNLAEFEADLQQEINADRGVM